MESFSKISSKKSFICQSFIVIVMVVMVIVIVHVLVEYLVIVKENFNVIVIVVDFVIVKLIEDFKTLKNRFFILPLIG